MTPHHSTDDRGLRPPSGRLKPRGVIELGWAHFWLLSGILGGLLATLAMVLFAHVRSL